MNTALMGLVPIGVGEGKAGAGPEIAEAIELNSRGALKTCEASSNASIVGTQCINVAIGLQHASSDSPMQPSTRGQGIQVALQLGCKCSAAHGNSCGRVFDFLPGWRGHLAPPLGAKCPSGRWKGVLRGGEASLASRDLLKMQRICLEACTRFDELAHDACIDCTMHTLETDYYMLTSSPT